MVFDDDATWTVILRNLMASNTIAARTLKGFRDYLPHDLAPRQHMLREIERVFERYGFSPLQTTALEYAEILLGRRPLIITKREGAQSGAVV